MKVLINQNDAAFLRQVLQAMKQTAAFDREGRRKLNRLENKLSASRGLWAGFNLKTREIATLGLVLTRTIRNLDAEIEALTAFTPTTPEDGTEAAKQLRADRINQLGLYKEFAGSVAQKLSDTLGQNDGVPEYISQSVDKAEDEARHEAHHAQEPAIQEGTVNVPAEDFEKAAVVA